MQARKESAANAAMAGKDVAVGSLMRVPTAAAYIGHSTSTLAKMRMRGTGPPYIKTARLVLYDQRDLDAWLTARKRISTSEHDSEQAK